VNLEQIEQAIEDLDNRLTRLAGRLHAEASAADQRIGYLEIELGEVRSIAEDARYAAERR
jgi:hypothetical protein